MPFKTLLILSPLGWFPNISMSPLPHFYASAPSFAYSVMEFVLQLLSLLLHEPMRLVFLKVLATMSLGSEVSGVHVPRPLCQKSNTKHLTIGGGWYQSDRILLP